jgi:hypothetical protein
MKRIIDGKRYDTETAEKLHEWDNGIYGGDFKQHDEALYKTEKGAYFVHGTSGPMGPYSQNLGNGAKGGGEILSPMTEKEAFEWLTSHGGEEVAEKYFPNMIEDA